MRNDRYKLCETCSRNKEIVCYCATKKKQRKIYSENVKETWKRASQKYYKNNKHKKIARVLLQQAVKNGKIKKKNCAICGDEKSEGHHIDYSKPYDVIWLCKQHHENLHHSIGSL